MEKIIIKEKVTLNVIKTDKFKTNYLSFNFISPLEREKASYNALIPQVLIRGTAKHPDLASIKNRLDDLYAASVDGRVYRRGEYQICGMTASWLADKYAIDGTDVTSGTLDILEELIFEPYLENGVFAEGYVSVEKNNLIDDINGMINNKNTYAVRRCHQEMCRDEAFGICEYGEIEEIKKITPEKLYQSYKELLETSVIEIFFIGHGDVADVLAGRIGKMLEGKERRPIALGGVKVIRDVNEVKHVTEQCKAAQGKLSLGFRTGCVLGERDYLAFPVFVEMYGNSPVSKLFMNVREKLSLCYYCRAIPEGIKGIMVVTSGIEVSNKEKAQNEILEQLDSIRRGEVTDEELETAKRSLKNSYNELNDSPPSLEGWYLTRSLACISETHEDVRDGFMNVTKEDVIRIAKNIKLDTVYFLEGTLRNGDVEDDE